MKKGLLIIISLLHTVTIGAAADGRTGTGELWDSANTLYVNGDYDGATVLYDSILSRGYSSSKLYYNLGNAHFKSNRIGKAIVNYNRALELAPYDSDIEYNLDVANSYIKDRIEAVPEFVVRGWFRHIRSLLTSNMWAVVSLILFAGALACVLVYLLGQKKGVRKAGFFTAIFAVVLFFVAVSFSVRQRRELVNASHGVVISSAVSVVSSPERSSKELFIIHEGTKVKITGHYGDWTEITIADGNKGWLLSESIEKI